MKTSEELTAVLIFNGIIIREMQLFKEQPKIFLNPPKKAIDGGWKQDMGEVLEGLRQDEFWFVCRKGLKCYYHNV